MERKIADNILKKTQADYEAIAEAFTDSRSDLWEERQYFGEYAADGLSVLDLGCANGRVLKLFEKHKVAYTGVDVNATFLKAAMKYAESFPALTATFVQSDMRALPFAENSFDRIFCIASLHHIPSAEYQLQAVREMFRVLKPGGFLLMTNWNIGSQARYVKKREKLLAERPELFEGFGDQDFIITWKWRLGGETIYRYYYSFTEQELAELLTSAGFKVISQTISDGGLNLQSQRVKRNIVTIAAKQA